MNLYGSIDFPYKILAPQRPPHFTARPRLIDSIRAIIKQRVIVLVTPAGYGKTSLLIDFAHSTVQLPICWYSLDRRDQDPHVFLSYLAAAIAQQFPQEMQPMKALFTGRTPPPIATITAALIRNVAAIETDFMLILDDWHLVDLIADISQVITQLVLSCPTCHIIISSRTYPSIPDLMLLVARQQLSGLSTQHLHFTASEVTAVLHALSASEISNEQATALVNWSNGWITGILLSFQAAGLAASAPITGAITQSQMYQYLAEQVLNQQPPEIRAFLLDTSLLEDLTAEWCNIILERNDSQQLLDMLVQQHVFITEIRSGILRYHPLFREFLSEYYRKLDPQRHQATALRIANHAMERGQWPLAFDVCIAAGDIHAAQRIAAAGGEYLYTQGRLETLERWFSALPRDILNAPLLCLHARVLLGREGFFEAQALADLAAMRMHPAEQVEVMLLQAWLAHISGRYEQACELTQQALGIEHSPVQRVKALRTQAICRFRLGQVTQAITELQEALATARQHDNLANIAQILHDLGICYSQTERLQAAEELYRQADAYWAMLDNIGQRSMSRNSLGIVHHLMGRYHEAHTILSMALQDARNTAMLRYQATILLSLGDLYSDLQCWDQADQSYAAARRIGGSAYIMRSLDLAAVRVLIRRGRYEAAARALQQLPETTLHLHAGVAALLRGGIACGLKHYDQALDDAQSAITALESAHAPMDLARAHLLKARVAASKTPIDSAMLTKALEQAIAVADQVGYDAFLVAETLSMSNLLTCAGATTIARVADWLQRHRDVLTAAQSLGKDDQQPTLTIRALGTDQISLNDQPIDIGWRKAREVLYYLLSHPGGASSETLCAEIWPDLTAQSGSETLRRAIYRLRAALPRELIISPGRQRYQVNRKVVQLDYDVERFLEALDIRTSDHKAIIAAIEIYKGSYLPWSDSSWSRDMRMGLEQRYLFSLRSTAKRWEEADAYIDALILYQRVLMVEQLDEATHAGVMRSHIMLGNRAAAIEQYHSLRHILNAELGIDPGVEVEQLYRDMLAAT